jgi:hypothetical protein
MAQTEIQLPSKAELYRDIRTLANEISMRALRWQQASDFINTLTVADLDAIGVPAGQIRTDLADLKQVLNELVLYYNGSGVTPVKSPDTVMDKLRSMLIV